MGCQTCFGLDGGPYSNIYICKDISDIVVFLVRELVLNKIHSLTSETILTVLKFILNAQVNKILYFNKFAYYSIIFLFLIGLSTSLQLKVVFFKRMSCKSYRTNIFQIDLLEIVLSTILWYRVLSISHKYPVSILNELNCKHFLIPNVTRTSLLILFLIYNPTVHELTCKYTSCSHDNRD